MLVSVYIPTRNRLALLERAVDSVLEQTYRPIEVIVVNDGSSDATAPYLNDLQHAGKARVIHNEVSGGAPRARNQAILAARGEFITGLDDDDCFDAGRIEAFVSRWQALESSGERFSCLYGRDILRQGTAQSTLRKPARVAYEDLFFHNSIGNQVFTRREYLVAAGMFDERMPAWQDLDAFMRLVRRFGPAHLAQDALYMLDLDPRADRISVGSRQRIYEAYTRLAEKSAQHAPALRQALYLQVFGPLYGFRLGTRELREFFSHGLHRRTLKRLAGVLVRQTLSA